MIKAKKDMKPQAAFDKINSAAGIIRKIGNSKGILLSTSILKAIGISENAEVIITTENGQITIKPVKNQRKINTDLSTWEAHFKTAMKSGVKPEKDLFESMENIFDKDEW